MLRTINLKLLILGTIAIHKNEAFTPSKINYNDYNMSVSNSMSNEIGDKDYRLVNTVSEEKLNLPCERKGRKAMGSAETKSITVFDNYTYPFAVAILKKGSFFANGALLDNGWVLTAASDFYYAKESQRLFKVRLGSVDSKHGGIVVPIKRIEIHPSYQIGRPLFDLALLKIGIEIEYNDYIRPTNISDVKDRVKSAKFLVTYWPRLIINSKNVPESAPERYKYRSMRVSLQEMMPVTDCYNILKMSNVVRDDSLLCLKPLTAYHSVCMPDLGAPVSANDGLWGITSSWVSPSCNREPTPTIMVRLSTPLVKYWIDEIVYS